MSRRNIPRKRHQGLEHVIPPRKHIPHTPRVNTHLKVRGILVCEADLQERAGGSLVRAAIVLCDQGRIGQEFGEEREEEVHDERGVGRVARVPRVLREAAAACEFFDTRNCISAIVSQKKRTIYTFEEMCRETFRCEYALQPSIKRTMHEMRGFYGIYTIGFP